MAITSAIMQMRRGNETDFDPDKMHPGEWAVSTDEKYVRMCFSPGVCVRMATYETFEEDMEQIISILEEANTVKEAIEEIYKEFQEAELDIEAAENAAILSESYAKGGTGTREGEDTDNAKYYAESVANTISDVALNRQTLGYTKKNLLKLFDNSQTINGIKYSVNVNEGTITIDGKATAYSYSGMGFAVEKKYIKAGAYIFNGCPPGGRVDGVDYYRQTLTLKYADGTTGTSFGDYGEDITFSVTQEEEERGVYLHYTIYVFPGTTVNNLTFYPMVRSADITDDTFEPYVDDVDTRLKALTPVNNFLATVPGSPLDAVIGKMLNDMIVALEERLKWKSITVPEPVVEDNRRTYNIDLSSYAEVEIIVFVKSYSQFNTYRASIPTNDFEHAYFYDEYVDQNSYVWAGRTTVYNSKIIVETHSHSTNPTANPLVIHSIKVR